jgi:hypothetical protein
MGFELPLPLPGDEYNMLVQEWSVGSSDEQRLVDTDQETPTTPPLVTKVTECEPPVVRCSI